MSARLKITEKGTDEVERRLYGLSIRKRSVLVHLKKAQTVQYILDRSVFQQDEVIYEINTLKGDGFLEMSSIGATERVPRRPITCSDSVLDDEVTSTKAASS